VEQGGRGPGGGGQGADEADVVGKEMARLEKVDLDAVYRPQLLRWHLPALYYTLRLAMAPAIESLLLLDRLLFLRELPDVQAAIIPAFDPSTSPRNFVIAARRVPPRPT